MVCRFAWQGLPAQGAASRLTLSLTHRSAARRVQYVTGHGEKGTLPEDIDWRRIADPSVTTVIYMPKKTLRQFTDHALAAGLDPETPALAIANATRANEQVAAATIDALADAALPEGPTIVMIGSVCGAAAISAHSRRHAESATAISQERADRDSARIS
jgi:uroporphyrin-III C-methyltransferase/precorrin-2 dehydrogenase/sirohydrochlorin ferrochelatase